MARGDVARREVDGRHDGLVLDAHAVVVFVAFFEAAQNRDGIFARRFVDRHLLEAAFERLVLLEILLVFVQGRGAHGAQLAARKGRFQNVGRIHRTRRFAGTHQGVDFVDEEQDVALARHDLLHHGFQPLLELALILGARDERSHVERVDDLVFQVFGDVAIDDAACDALGDGRFTDARLAH